MTGCLYLQDKQMFIWASPEVILKAGLSLTILTYKSEGSLFVAYLRKLGLPFALEVELSIDQKFKENASKLVTIEDIPALSKLKLSCSGQQKGQSSPAFYNKVSLALKNLREQKLKGINVENILINLQKRCLVQAHQ